MVVFLGKQGDFKSTSIMIVGGKWSAISNNKIGSPEFTLSIKGKLLMEIGELASFRKTDIESIKNCCTTRTDHHRVPYDRHYQDMPRYCMFAGTTNEHFFLSDSTGNRRFLPVTTGRIDINRLIQDRDQLFAEAACVVKSNPDWWRVSDMAEEHQESHRLIDPWEEKLSNLSDSEIQRAGLDSFEGFQTIDIASKILGIKDDSMDKNMAGRITKILIRLGYENKPTSVLFSGGYRSIRRWRKTNQPKKNHEQKAAENQQNHEQNHEQNHVTYLPSDMTSECNINLVWDE